MTTASLVSSPRTFDRAALRVVFLSSLGGALEFYDFIVFGTFAAYISRAFFPANDPAVSLLNTFTVFGVGYLARPIGGLLFGQRGDRVGRRHSFLLSLATMSAATILIGVLPTFSTGGVWATGAFVLLRLVQGFCLGGELAGAITYAVEVVPTRRATLACGVVFGCVSSGVLLATCVSAALHTLLTPETMEVWGWRLAFILGGLLGVVSWGLRRSLEESPAFLQMSARLAEARAAGVEEKGPLAELFRNYSGRIFIGIGATAVVAVFNGLLFAQMPAYLGRTLHYPAADIAVAINIAVAAMSVSLVAASWVGDLIPRRYVFRAGCVVLALGAFPLYRALVAHSWPLSWLFLIVGLSACFTHGIFAAILADLFPTRVRFSGVAVTLNVGAVLFSGLMPLAATWLIVATGRDDAPAFLVVGAAVLALVIGFWLKHLEGHIALGDAGTIGETSQRSMFSGS